MFEIELLLQDFPESNPTYSAAHVFFLSCKSSTF
ncbi:unnamed protein product [Schistosoma mattheei]|uniref:Uncharacterized protein n=1 Tax=Schistosoma mattheei TaxID=31246 RepID=A0A183NEF1_9TREM|nr:unnamed protein product [Schistosoma mattheei]